MIKAKILDTTIRDGSYAVDFKFSCSDVRDVVSRSAKLGIELIEIGHGMGLNASSPERGVSLFSDAEYISAAKSVSGTSKIGTFCIPGIARLDDIPAAAAQGLNFVRIGVLVKDLATALPYVEVAKKNGLMVMLNFMKSYAADANQFAEAANEAYKSGADCVYLVDSAGCMLENDIETFFYAAKERNENLPLGFHGHNNLGIAVANSLKCAELGFNIIDCSYQGLGRSLGNTPLEMYLMAAKNKFKGAYEDFDIPRVLEYGYCIIKNITNNNAISPLDLVCGYTGFHSSYLKYIYKTCLESNVDPLRLIIAYSKFNKGELDLPLLEKVAKTLPHDIVDSHPYNFREYFNL